MNKTKTIYNTIRSAKFVLKPTIKQKDILESFFGLSRAIYNILNTGLKTVATVATTGTTLKN